MKKLMSAILALFLICGCQNKKEDAGEIKEDLPETVTEKEETGIKEISEEDIYELNTKNQRFVETNFYLGTPEWELGTDFDRMDKETYATPALKCHSMAEFKDYMKDNYDLSKAFIDKLIDSHSSSIYEKDDELWIVSAGRGGDITVGSETGHEIIRQDGKIILRISHEELELNTDTGTETIKGTFETDNILIYEDGRWVFEDIPSFR